MLISILILLLVVCLLCWLISVAPIPAAPFPGAILKWFLYAIVILFAVAYLLKAAGIALP